MPVRIILKDDCRKLPITFHYEGPNVHVVYPGLKKFLADVLNVPEEQVHEKQLSVSRSGDEEKIKAKFDVLRRIDKYSYMLFEVSCSVEKRPSQQFESEGTVDVEIKGKLMTEIPQNTAWQKSFVFQLLFTLFLHTWYNKKRKGYLNECKDAMFELERRFKKLLRIE